VNFCTLCQCLALCGVFVFCDETFSSNVCVCLIFCGRSVTFYVVFLGLLRPVSVSLLRVCAVLCMSVASTGCVTAKQRKASLHGTRKSAKTFMNKQNIDRRENSTI